MKEVEEYYIIDVRTPMEYKKSHLDGAINISYIGFNFGKKIKKLDNIKTVFIYCQSTHRRPYTAKKLKKLGFTEVIDRKGGYKEYKKMGKE